MFNYNRQTKNEIIILQEILVALQDELSILKSNFATVNQISNQMFN